MVTIRYTVSSLRQNICATLPTREQKALWRPAARECRRACKLRAPRDEDHGFPGLLPHRVRLHQGGARGTRRDGSPGRGSAAGSVVAYCLGITKIDPLKYDLLFERFLNPDRVNLPDIDTDFDDDGRGKVLRWVMDKYGHENCAHIITYGSMATKNSIKDVARVEKLPLDKANALCKAIPDRLPDGA